MKNKVITISQIKKKRITTTGLVISLLLLNVIQVQAEEIDDNKPEINSQEQLETEMRKLNKRELKEVPSISKQLLEKESHIQIIELFNYFREVANSQVSKILEDSIATINNDEMKSLYIESLINHELGNYQASQEKYSTLLSTDVDKTNRDILNVLFDRSFVNIKITELKPEDFVMEEATALKLDEQLNYDTSVQTTSLSRQVATTQLKKESPDELYTKAMTSPGATPAWNAAQDLKRIYPQDSRVNEAINTTGRRQLILGMSNHRKGDFSQATEYYDRILKESVISQSLRTETSFYRTQSLERQPILTADDLYNEAMTSPSATPAWNAAQKLKEIFPQDSRIATAINTTGRRQLILGMSSHRKRDFSKSNEYYKRILDESGIDNLLRLETNFYQEQSLKKQVIRTADDLYNEAMTLPNATPAWNAAQKLKEVFPFDSRLNQAINTTANRQLILGMSSHRKREFDKAIDYYERILGETLLSESVKQNVKVYLTQAIDGITLRTADELYKEAMTLSGATPAWNAAQELMKWFPHDSRFIIAINTTANRQLILGMANHRNNQYSKANEYYERLLSEIKINNSLKHNATVYLDQSLKSQALRTADDMYNDAITSTGATPAWNAAQELKKTFPNDTRVNEAINITANRQLILGKSNHLNGNINSAISYYNRILSEDRVDTIVAQETSVYFSQATNGKSLRTADMIYRDAENASGATPAWRLARELKSLFPHDSRVRTLLNRSAQRLLILGMDSHKNNDLNNAKSYYQNILLEPSIERTIYQKAESYNYLVENNLGLTNMIVRYTNYSTHITDATNKQMALKAKPQISHNGGWRDATRDEVLFNINPTNSIPEDINYALSTLKIVASTLNVRSTPEVKDNIIQKAYKDEMYTIVDEHDGWYRIALSDGSHGWVSSGTAYIKRDTDVLQFLVLSGSSVVNVTELNKVLSGAGILSNKGSSFNKASTLSNVNELYLVAHSLLETGNGTSNLATGIRVTQVNGKPVTPRIVYNMYGIGAYDSNPDKFGSERAYTEGWFTPEQAIIGGAEWISKSYINNPTYRQDTLYKMRWNPDSPGVHQYATDVAWSQKQTRDLIKIVSLARKHNLILNFNIPVYN